MDPADQAKELKRKRAEHKKSQASLDALSDLEYWDLELAIRRCDEDEEMMWHAFREERAVIKKLSQEDLHESARALMKKKAQLKVETDHIRDQRQRLAERLSSTELGKDLRRSRDAFTLILNKAVHDKFRPGPRDSGIQSIFRKVLIHEHQFINSEAEDKLWCSVLKAFHKSLS